MGVSTDGQISYGIAFEEGFEFPWSNHDGIEEWWREVSGYKPPFEIYGEDGDYIGGKRPPEEKISEYYAHKFAFDREHRVPVKLVNVCSGDYPIYILALMGIGQCANRGYPVKFNPAELVVTDDQRNSLIEFCKTHSIDTGDNEPSWYLSSYWG